MNPTFADFAENCGAHVIRVESTEELEPALEEALGHEGPSLVEVLTDVDPV